MRETAHEVLRLLGLQDHQAVIVEHTDQPHAHVHLCVNLVHPETGIANTLSNDGYKLDRWCDNYELRMGVIRSPDRRAKFAALDEGLEPPPTKKHPSASSSRTSNPPMKTARAKQRAAAIKADQEAYAAASKRRRMRAWKRRKAESRALWKDYRTSSQAIRDRHTAARSTKSRSTSATATPCPSRSRVSATGKRRANGRS